MVDALSDRESAPVLPKESQSKTEITDQDRERINSTLKNLYHICVGAWEGVPWMVIITDEPISRISQLKPYKETETAHQEIWDQTKKLWLNREEFPARMNLSNGVEAEQLRNSYQAEVVDLGDGPVKLLYSTDCNQKNINQVVIACRKAKAATHNLGLNGVPNNHLVLIDSQLLLQDSRYDPIEDVVIVGSRGIVDFADSDLPSVGVHEETHARVDHVLHGFGIDRTSSPDDYTFSPLLYFLNEGSAMYVQHALMGISSKNKLRSALASLSSAHRVQLFCGLYSEKLNFFTDLSRTKDQDPLFLFTQLRDLPGSFMEYCISKGFNLDDLMKALITKSDEIKPEIAQKLGITMTEGVINTKQILQNILQAKENTLTDDEIASLEAKINDAVSSAKFRPFQLLASLDGKSDEISAIKEFLNWIEAD